MIDPARTADFPTHSTQAGGRDPATRIAPPSTPNGGPARPGSAAAPHDIPGYELLGELGRGGMGVVYKARQVSLNRTVALKVVLGSDRFDSKARIRFLAEAEAVAAVKHPHVVQVYDFGDHDGRPYLALEFVDGGTLADLLRQAGRLAPRDAAGLVAQIARGVQAAHDQGIVHRDLKPGNVLLARRDPAVGSTLSASGLGGPAPFDPKITDFGLAKRGAGSDLTRTQAVMGTPAYMSPEQAKGETKFVGPAADVWALGVILYECLTGTRPFTDDDAWVLMHNVVTLDPDPPRSHAPAVPRDLELVCLKCLEKDPHRRYPTAAALADDLGRLLAGQPVTARPVRAPERVWRWAGRNPVLAAAAAGLLVAVVGLVVALANGYQQANARAETERRLREQESAAKEVEAAARAEAERLRAEAAAAAARANQVSDFLSGMFQSSDPMNIFGAGVIPPSWERERRKTAEDFLRDAAARFRTELADQPLARAKLLASVGNSFKNLGLFRDADPLLREALALRAAHLPASHPDVAASEYDLGRLLIDTGDFPAAIDRLRAAAAAQEQAGGADGPAALTSRMFEGMANALLGLPAAEPILRANLAARERVYGRFHPEAMIIKVGLAAYLIDDGRAAEAAPLIPDIIEGLKAQPDNQLRQLAQVTVDFQAGILFRDQAAGNAFLRDRLLRQAEASLRKSLAGGLVALPDDHIYLTLVRHELAVTLERIGKGDEADALYAKCLDSVRKTTGLAHPKVLVLAESYAGRLARTGRRDQARALYEEVDRANRERFGPANHWRAILLLTRAEFEAEPGGDPDRAKALAAAAVELADAGKLTPTRHAAAGLFHAAAAVGRHSPTGAGALYRHARAAAARVYGDPCPLLALAALREGEQLFAAGEHAAGAALVGRAEAIAAALPKKLDARSDLFRARGRVEAARGAFADAEGYHRRALELSRAGSDPWDREADATAVAAVLLDAGRAADAVPFLDEARRAVGRAAKASDYAKARAAVGLAAGKLAAGDRDGHREVVADLHRRYAGAADLNPVCEVGRAVGLCPDAAGVDAAALAGRMAAALAAAPRARVGHRSLALVRVRAGAGPAEVRGLLNKVSGVVTPADHLIYGLALAKAGEADRARAQLWKAEALSARRKPTAARPFAYASGYWLDRVEERLLAAELAGLLPPAPPPAKAPPPRPVAAGG